MVDYNNFAKTFSKSRKNMKWEEMEFFLEKLSFSDDTKILDIGCGNGRFLGELVGKFGKDIQRNHYIGVDLSSGLLEEAKKDYPDFDFHEGNMLDIDKVVPERGGVFSDIFFYASFHHLGSIQERKFVLDKVYHLLNKGGKVYMTNWALNSGLNHKRYQEAMIPNSQNEYGSVDFNIKLAGNDRYYHCFSLGELQMLAEHTGFQVIENRLFPNERNFITILEK